MEFRGPALVLERSLIISDLHLGLEDRHAGASALVTHPQAVLDLVCGWIDEDIDRVIFNGDVLDDFALSRIESRLTIGRLLRSFVSEHESVLIRGNHDPMLASLGLTSVASFRIGSTLILHGDRHLQDVASEDDLRSCKTIIIGHEHPAIELSDGIRMERFKCFVRIERFATSFGEKELIIMPSAHPDVLGTQIGSFRSPLFERTYPEAQVFVASEQPRYFGTIASLT
jgi:uncharacterized protein